MPVASINELSYSTKQNSASFAQGDAVVPLTLSRRPNWHDLRRLHDLRLRALREPAQGPVVADLWQSWDVDAGLMWSSRTYTGTARVCGGRRSRRRSVLHAAGLKTMCPTPSTVVGFGVNVGSNNPSWDVEADFVNFNGTKYDFEMFVVATDKDQCKDGGWQTLSRANGTAFKNQGDCVSYTNNGR